MPLLDPTVTLSSRQEAFCRHFTASGNAADAARQAGYAKGSARQTGCALLERPYIVERVRRIRMSWRRTEKDEARIALARLEQAWDAAVASGSAYLMLQIVRLQAEIAGLVRPASMRRAVLWPVAGEDEFGEMAEGDAPEAGTAPGPLADAVRRGRDRAERVFARHSASREVLERQEDFDEIAHEETARKLAEAVEERERLPVSFEPPAPPPAEDRPQADDPPEETYTSGLGARLMVAIRGPHIVAPALSRGPALPAQPAEASTDWTPNRRSAPSGVTRGGRSCRPATHAPAPPDCRGTRSPSSVPANDRQYYEEDERPSDDDRVDGAENDWLYQRRNGFAELYDPWTPENIELRRRNSLAWEEARCGNEPFDPEGPDWPDTGEFAPDHDIS